MTGLLSSIRRRPRRPSNSADNFQDRRSIVFARNAVFNIARDLGFKYFIQLDDDYTEFQYRFNSKWDYKYKLIKNLDTVFKALLRFFEKTDIYSIAMAQGGDYIGGPFGRYAKTLFLSRKCMNTFICSVDRPFRFVGRINEDVTAYTWGGSTGRLFFTFNGISIVQKQTQGNRGGMTDIYQANGTYVKSFYTVLFQPSSVKVSMIPTRHARIHHRISWAKTVPCILSEKYKKRA